MGMFSPHIEKDAFAKLPKLKYLSLRRNDIDFGDLPNMLFGHLRELFSLDISENNMWRTLDEHYRDDILEHLTSLRHLKMDSLENAAIGLGFSGLKNLTHLTFRAKMKYIWNDTFVSLGTLPITHLTINSGWLMWIDSMALSHFPLLHTLDLSYNPLLGFTNAANGWPGLQYTSVKELLFQYSTPYDTSIITMEENFFEGLQYTNLTKFAVDGNQIITIPGVFTTYIPQITYLSLSYNRLTQVAELIADIGRLEHLVYLDASYQSVRSNISSIEVVLRTKGPTTFYSKSAASESYHNVRYDDANNVLYDNDDMATAVANGDVSALCPINNDTDRFSITLYSDDISPLPWGFYVPFTIPPNSQVVKLASSLFIVTNVFPMICVFNTHKIKYFDYSGNAVSRFEYPIVIVNDSENPITLNLRSNGISYISNNTLVHGTAVSRCLETLLLGDNELGPSLEQIGLAHLSALYVLKNLDISANGIRHLQHDALSYLPQLQVLELDTNSLRDVSFHMHFLENLTYLGLSHNLLSSIGHTTRSTFDVIANSNGRLSLALAGNPFICSCDTLDFLKWAIELDPGKNGSLQIIDFGEVVCTFDENSNASFAESLDDIIKQLNMECNIIKYIVITVVSAAVITVVVGLSMGCRHRWDIRFWFLNLTMRWKRRAAIADELNEIYRYDAFVSYHDDSVGWIKSDMLPSLEECDDPLKLCLHDRDFIVGNAVNENIMNSIQNSRKTVLLINRDFINSNWCKFETEMVHLESVNKGRDIVIAILLEPASVLLKHPIMYQTLRTLLRKRTYIEWPRNRLQQDMFWEKVYEAIRNPIMRPLQCVCGRALDRTFSRLISTDDASRDDGDTEALAEV